MKATKKTVGDLIDTWQEQDQPQPLLDVLEWTPQEYTRWVESGLTPEQKKPWYRFGDGPWPNRFWRHPRGTWDGKLLHRGDDEWGRWVITLRLPGHRGLSFAYRWCMCSFSRQRCACGHVFTGWSGGQVLGCYWCGLPGPWMNDPDYLPECIAGTKTRYTGSV